MIANRTRMPVEEEFKVVLEGNPFVDHVTRYDVFYTEDFKKEFWIEYSEEQISAAEIFRRHGFDVERLGHWRIEGFKRNLIKKHNASNPQKHKKGVNDKDKSNQYRKEIIALEHKIELLQQQLEFIKKTIELARKERQ